MVWKAALEAWERRRRREFESKEQVGAAMAMAQKMLKALGMLIGGRPRVMTPIDCLESNRENKHRGGHGDGISSISASPSSRPAGTISAVTISPRVMALGEELHQYPPLDGEQVESLFASCSADLIDASGKLPIGAAREVLLPMIRSVAKNVGVDDEDIRRMEREYAYPKNQMTPSRRRFSYAVAVSAPRSSSVRLGRSSSVRLGREDAYRGRAAEGQMLFGRADAHIGTADAQRKGITHQTMAHQAALHHASSQQATLQRTSEQRQGLSR